MPPVTAHPQSDVRVIHMRPLHAQRVIDLFGEVEPVKMFRHHLPTVDVDQLTDVLLQAAQLRRHRDVTAALHRPPVHLTHQLYHILQGIHRKQCLKGGTPISDFYEHTSFLPTASPAWKS